MDAFRIDLASPLFHAKYFPQLRAIRKKTQRRLGNVLNPVSGTGVCGFSTAPFSPNCFRLDVRTSLQVATVEGMNTSRTIVRIDEDQRTAELEIMTPHSYPQMSDTLSALWRVGILQLSMIELSTPRYRVTRSKLVARDGSLLNGTRVMQILEAVQYGGRGRWRSARPQAA